VLVTTPQSLAAMVVRKSANLAAQLDIPIIGVIENMSYVQCPDCDRVIELFGPSRGPALAQEVGAPLLGRLPVDPEIAKLGDLGQLETYDGEDFARIAERLMPLIPEEAKQPQL